MKNLPDINPLGARYSVRVEASAGGGHSPEWRSVMRIVAAYQSAGYRVEYVEEWSSEFDATERAQSPRAMPYRIARITCKP